MGTGHIVIPRAIEDWEWIDDKTMFYFWIRILLMANWEEKRWHGENVEKGSFVTSLGILSKTLGLSVRQVRTCLERLISDKQIVLETTNKRTKVTICNYDSYQGYATNKRQTSDKQVAKKSTTTKEYNTSDTNVSSYSIQETLFKEEEGDTPVSPKKVPVDYVFIKWLWNDSMKNKVPKIQAISDSRKEKIKLRVTEMGGWEQAEKILPDCFKKINESEFCNGENDQKWVATFDWFFTNDKNWCKVYEGNYDNKRRASRFEQSMDVAQKAKNLIGLIYGPGNERTADGLADTPDEQ